MFVDTAMDTASLKIVENIGLTILFITSHIQALFLNQWQKNLLQGFSLYHQLARDKNFQHFHLDQPNSISSFVDTLKLLKVN